MNVPGTVKELRSALDFVMLKTKLQRLCVVGGGYGLLACAYGLPGHHQDLYVVHVFLGVALSIVSITSLVIPKPGQLTLLGALLVLMGVWINIMAGLGEGAGGSPKVFAAWGGVLLIAGIFALLDYRHFSYLGAQMPPKADIKHAGVIVKNLLSANPKKQLDTMIIYIKEHPNQLHDAALGERSTAARNTGKWKARLLPNVIVLIQGGPARALVLCRRNFNVLTTLEEYTAASDFAYSVCISERVYSVSISKESVQQLKQWLITEEQMPMTC